jgi:hypothetical protein
MWKEGNPENLEGSSLKGCSTLCKLELEQEKQFVQGVGLHTLAISLAYFPEAVSVVGEKNVFSSYWEFQVVGCHMDSLEWKNTFIVLSVSTDPGTKSFNKWFLTVCFKLTFISQMTGIVKVFFLEIFNAVS